MAWEGALFVVFFISSNMNRGLEQWFFEKLWMWYKEGFSITEKSVWNCLIKKIDAVFWKSLESRNPVLVLSFLSHLTMIHHVSPSGTYVNALKIKPWTSVASSHKNKVSDLIGFLFSALAETQLVLISWIRKNVKGNPETWHSVGNRLNKKED